MRAEHGPAHRCQRGVARPTRSHASASWSRSASRPSSSRCRTTTWPPGRGAPAGADADHARRIAVRPDRRRARRRRQAVRPVQPAAVEVRRLHSVAAAGAVCASSTASATSSAARSARRPSCRRPAGTSPCSVADLRYLEGSYDRHLVREALATRTSPSAGAAGRRRWPGRGLGVGLDPAALERVTVRKEALLG